MRQLSQIYISTQDPEYSCVFHIFYLSVVTMRFDCWSGPRVTFRRSLILGCSYLVLKFSFLYSNCLVQVVFQLRLLLNIPPSSDFRVFSVCILTLYYYGLYITVILSHYILLDIDPVPEFLLDSSRQADHAYWSSSQSCPPT